MKHPAHKTISLFLLFLLFLIAGCTDFDDNARLFSAENLKNHGAIFEKKSELYQTLKKATANEVSAGEEPPCVEIIYPLSLVKYDSELRPIGSANVKSDAQFSQLLSNLPEEESLSISFPIKTVLADNTTYTVNNNSELNIALNNCTRDDIIRTFTDAFVSPFEIKSIFWKVKYSENGDNTYYSGIFQISTGGFLTFYYNNKKYHGTWFFLMVDDKLHLNINLDDTSEVGKYWNMDNAMELNGPEMIIKTLPKNILLEQIIESRIVYKVGDKGPSKGTIFYDKGEYTNGWRYIEAASNDLKSSEWGCASSAITKARNSEIGRGAYNTAQILRYHDSLVNYYKNPAICNPANDGSLLAKYAVRYIQEQSADWFLPSSEELELIHKNLYLNNLENLTNSNYWSSTEINEAAVSTILFETGEKVSTPKIPAKNTVKARAIRYF
ncbi:hypothetical protein EV144_102219 [Flavobacterium sp. 270]|uniref:hypothetical protein n=1 Tax=Flavobacterium sp. 270 TaxID=2512114 RepID=UPI0010661262|nr:hypothetical protein [Flavobacterium sp. 270]TDW49796.1 hypothetical protein EV144_102219 [Flavobacterium sp. 270]